MLADDHLGKDRESPDNLDAYTRAFEAVDADPKQILAVAEDAGELVGTVRLTFVRGMARQGATSVLVNEVRVRSDRRGGRLGTELITG